MSAGGVAHREGLQMLRAPFAPEQVGKLPKLTCRDCTKSSSKHCDRHAKARCEVCSNWISTAHVDLDYVGHAAVTDRLLAADPGWAWEPVAFNERGLPLIDESGEEATMWIRLTVCGVTRLGVGTVSKGAFDRDKQLISDALRNAAMRFGVALDLWSKEDLHAEGEAQYQAPPATEEQIATIKANAEVLTDAENDAVRDWAHSQGMELKCLTATEAEALIAVQEEATGQSLAGQDPSSDGEEPPAEATAEITGSNEHREGSPMDRLNRLPGPVMAKAKRSWPDGVAWPPPVDPNDLDDDQLRAIDEHLTRFEAEVAAL